MFAHRVDERTQLRLLQQHHAEALFEVVDRNRDHLRAWLPWVDGTTEVQDSMDFVVMQIYTFAQQGLMTCGVWHDGELCGVIGHNTIDPEARVTTLGYWLDAGKQGHGVMTRCVAAFLDHAFSEYGQEVVQIRVAPGNARSVAIPERLGFVRGEVLADAERLHDRVVDHVVYRMRREDWAQTV